MRREPVFISLDIIQTVERIDNLYRLSRLFDMHMEDFLVEVRIGDQADNKTKE